MEQVKKYIFNKEKYYKWMKDVGITKKDKSIIQMDLLATTLEGCITTDPKRIINNLGREVLCGLDWLDEIVVEQKEEQATKFIVGYRMFDGTIRFYADNNCDSNPSILKAKQFDSKEAVHKYLKKHSYNYDVILKVNVVITPIREA